jgi:hypothetical protein
MKKFLLITGIIVSVISCTKDKISDPKIIEFSANPTSLPKRDTVTFTIDAVGDNITFFDGKAINIIDQKDLPKQYKVGKIRFRVTAPADTVWAKLTVVNAYSDKLIKEVTDSIAIILLDE